MHKHFVKTGRAVPEICSRTDRKTDEQTHRHAYLGAKQLLSSSNTAHDRLFLVRLAARSEDADDCYRCRDVCIVM